MEELWSSKLLFSALMGLRFNEVFRFEDKSPALDFYRFLFPRSPINRHLSAGRPFRSLMIHHLFPGSPFSASQPPRSQALANLGGMHANDRCECCVE